MNRTVLVLMVFLVAAANVGAVPIVYEAQLFPGVPVHGVNTQIPVSGDEPVGANYFYFFANAGDPIVVWGNRRAGHYDMAFWIFQGLFSDTDQFGLSFSFADPNFIDFGDDEDPPSILGPFGDPRVTFVAPTTGFYTVAVTNRFSNDDPPNPFTLTFNYVPEPGTLILVGLGGVALAAFARRRSVVPAKPVTGSWLPSPSCRD
jgi:hypothetical protein